MDRNDSRVVLRGTSLHQFVRLRPTYRAIEDYAVKIKLVVALRFSLECLPYSKILAFSLLSMPSQ